MIYKESILVKALKRRVLCVSLLLTTTFVTLAAGQETNSPPLAASSANEKIEDASQKGFKFSSISSNDVTGNVSVEAALIPASVAKTVFGKEVSNNYAVIALTVSNRSANDAFIVHTIFLDYSQWLLAGNSPYPSRQNILCQDGYSKTATNNGGDSTASASSEVQSQGLDQSNREAAGSQMLKDRMGSSGGTVSGQAQGKNTPDARKREVANGGALNTAQTTRTYENCNEAGNRLQPWQQQTLPNQIDSVETRIVRGELLTRQPWTTRNWVLRALQATGSIATSFTFVTSSQSWIRGIGAFNGAGIPGYQSLWPDATVGQMNEISDVGFQVNKVVAKQSSSIIVAFFPIDRFLTPELKSIFLSYPAAFFSPGAAVMDPETSKRLKPYLRRLFNDTKDSDVNEQTATKNLFNYLPQISSGACEKIEITHSLTEATNLEQACQTADIINKLSLNTVRIVVGGTMTVDVNNVPPQISSITIKTSNGADAATTASAWQAQGDLTGTIVGSFLGGAFPSLVNPPAGVTVKRLENNSTDSQLQFTLNLASSLPASTTELTFEVSKTSSSMSIIKSATFDYAIPGTYKAQSSSKPAKPTTQTDESVPATEKSSKDRQPK